MDRRTDHQCGHRPGRTYVYTAADCKLYSHHCKQGTRYKPHLVKTYDKRTGVQGYSAGGAGQDRHFAGKPKRYSTVCWRLQSPGNRGLRFRDTKVNIAGKTGTAQTQATTATHSSLGFAPYENPQIAVAVVIIQGGSGNYSSPVAKAIIERIP